MPESAIKELHFMHIALHACMQSCMYSLQDLHIYCGVGQVKDMVEYLPMSYRLLVSQVAYLLHIGCALSAVDLDA